MSKFIGAMKRAVQSPEERLKMVRTLNERTIPKFLNSRYILSFTMLSFGVVFFHYARYSEKTRFQVSLRIQKLTDSFEGINHETSQSMYWIYDHYTTASTFESAILQGIWKHLWRKLR